MAAVTVDLAYALHNLVLEVNRRIDAADALPQTATRCSRLLDQVDGMLDGLNIEDKRIRVILESIKSCVEELNDLLDKLMKMSDVHAEKGGGLCLCLKLASKGKDVLDAEKELEKTEDELRKHIESLVQATQLHSFSTRTSNKLKQADSRRFWDEHFGDQREVSVAALAEALRFECREKGANVDPDVVMPICENCFSSDGTVTVLGFDEAFDLASVKETMQSLAKRVKAQSHMFAVQVFEYETKTLDTTTDAGFIMCRATDSLKVLRSLIKKHALSLGEEEEDSDDDEFDFEGAEKGIQASPGKSGDIADVPPEFQFMAEGAFTFFLDECKVRVTRKQEKSLEGREYIDRVCIVRDDDLPASLRPRAKSEKSMKGRKAPGSDAGDTAYETESVGTATSGDDAEQETGADDVAEALMARAAEEVAAKQCLDVIAAIRVPTVLQGLRVACVKAKIPEEAVTYMVEVDQLMQAAEAISPTSAGALSLPRLRLVKASATNISERFLADGNMFKLPVSAATAAAAAAEIARAAKAAEAEEPAPGLDHAMLEALEAPFRETEQALALALALLQKKQASVNKVMSKVKGLKGGEKTKHRVVILGGGYCGAICAFALDSDPEQRFHVTLIDPKNYFEEVTAQPMMLPDPGTLEEGRFSLATSPFAKTVPNGKHIAGLVTSISLTHVEVGAERTVVPFDSLLISTGSSYSSNIKVDNPSREYRLRQMQAEAAVMKHSDIILIVGGGLVGVEIASNVAKKYPEKRVVLVQGGPYLMPRVKHAHAKLLPYMESIGVEVHMNERVVEFDDMLRTYTTDKGNVFTAGKVYRCTGAKPNTEALKDPMSDPIVQASLDDKNFIKVDQHLRLHGAPNIFAGGDILEDKWYSSSGEHAVTGKKYPERVAASAGLHCSIVLGNIQRRVTNEPLLSMVPENDQLGSALEVSLGLEKGLVVGDPFLLDMYKSIGFDMGGDPEELASTKCSISEKVPGNKDQVTSMLCASTWNAEANAGVLGMNAMNPCIFDPIAPPPPAPAPSDPDAAAEALKEAVADVPKETEAPAVPEATPDEAPTEPEATPAEAPAEPEATPAEAPAEPEATPGEAPAEPEATPAEAPAEPDSEAQPALEPEAPTESESAAVVPAESREAPAPDPEEDAPDDPLSGEQVDDASGEP